MASCTVKNKRYGYWCGDSGTDATTVTSDLVKLKGIVTVAAGSASAFTVTDKAGDQILYVLANTANQWVGSYNFYGARVEGIIVTIGTTTGRVLILTE